MAVFVKVTVLLSNLALTAGFCSGDFCIGGTTQKGNATSLLSSFVSRPSFRCPSTQQSRELRKGFSLYHGTPYTFRGVPNDPAWYSSGLPPKNDLSIHVPLARICQGGLRVPRSFYIKRVEVKPQSMKLLYFEAAKDIYPEDSTESEHAKQFCSSCSRRLGVKGYFISKDSATQKPEYVLCTGQSDLEVAVEQPLEVTWKHGKKGNFMDDIHVWRDGTLQLRRGDDIFSVDCEEVMWEKEAKLRVEPAHRRRRHRSFISRSGTVLSAHTSLNSTASTGQRRPSVHTAGSTESEALILSKLAKKERLEAELKDIDAKLAVLQK